MSIGISADGRRVTCKRLTPGHGYLDALVADNVTVESTPIRRFTEEAIETMAGGKYPVDVIVCATGFDTSFRPNFPVIGQGGIDLREEWREEPRSYLSVAASGFPNYFSEISSLFYSCNLLASF